MVGEATVIGDRCSIKSSVIGAHCRLADNVKVINSVIMGHITAAEGFAVAAIVFAIEVSLRCIVQGSVLCNDVHLDANSYVKNSHFGDAVFLSANGKVAKMIYD